MKKHKPLKKDKEWNLELLEQSVEKITEFIQDPDNQFSSTFLQEYVQWWEVVKKHAKTDEQISITGC